MKRIYLKPRNAWRSLSVSHKLYAVVGIMAMLIATELFTLLFAMDTLSAVRAFVGGEGIWSKAQKDAVLEIKTYARSLDEGHYQLFVKNLQIPLGDHLARMELQKPTMEMSLVTQGFLAGQIHKDDIVPMVKLMTRFSRVPYIKKAIGYWSRGDDMIFQFIAVAEQLHELIQTSHVKPDQNEVNTLLERIFAINVELTEVENHFSATLGEASRWLEHVLMILLVTAVVTVEGTGFLLTVTFSRSLTRGLNELHNFAVEVGGGEFTKTLPVRSLDELGQVAMSLNKMASNLKEITSERQIADEANQIKNLFLANMSHEMRTPLNGILGFVSLLKQPALPHDKQQKYIEIIERTGYVLATIINDILDIAKVEAGQIAIEKVTCALPQILRDLEAILRLRCEKKGIQLRFIMEAVPIYIQADATRLKQILLNVIGNAIKFTNKGEVTATFTVQDSKLVCTVKDTGVGIAPENVHKLFKPFSQVDLSIRKRFGGTGLGLVLSRRLAQLMGGDVVLASSQVDHGSTFTISILLEPPQDLIAQTSHALGPEKSWPIKGTRILLVEDSIDNQLLVQEFLEIEGVKVDSAGDGTEAIKAAMSNDYDMVLMDMQMPIMDGYTATIELRKRGYRTPIIALTAHAMKEDLQKCLSVGCDGYLSKPFRIENLVSIVRRHCQPAAGTRTKLVG